MTMLIICAGRCCVDLSDHVNSPISPEIHESKWPVSWEKNRVNFIVTYTMCI